VSNKEVPLSLGKMLFSFHSTHPMLLWSLQSGY